MQTVYVFHSRVKLGAYYFVLRGDGTLDYLLQKQVPMELRIFERSFDSEGYLDPDVMAAAAQRFEQIDAQTVAAQRKAL